LVQVSRRRLQLRTLILEQVRKESQHHVVHLRLREATVKVLVTREKLMELGSEKGMAMESHSGV
jgi:hypothetical protein